MNERQDIIHTAWNDNQFQKLREEHNYWMVQNPIRFNGLINYNAQHTSSRIKEEVAERSASGFVNTPNIVEMMGKTYPKWQDAFEDGIKRGIIPKDYKPDTFHCRISNNNKRLKKFGNKVKDDLKFGVFSYRKNAEYLIKDILPDDMAKESAWNILVEENFMVQKREFLSLFDYLDSHILSYREHSSKRNPFIIKSIHNIADGLVADPNDCYLYQEHSMKALDNIQVLVKIRDLLREDFFNNPELIKAMRDYTQIRRKENFAKFLEWNERQVMKARAYI